MSTELEVAQPKQQQSLLTLPPREMIARATEYAEVLTDVIEKQKLYTVIQGKKYVRVEGWLTLGTMLGFTAREREVRRLDDGSYEASVDIIRYSDGTVLGGASALCSVSEKRWGGADEYARRSMSITRAVGKAYRINFSWIVALTGYETTPEEEMPREEKKPQKVAEKTEIEIFSDSQEQNGRMMLILEGLKTPKTIWLDVVTRMMGKPMVVSMVKKVVAEIQTQ